MIGAILSCERAHKLALGGLSVLQRLPLLRSIVRMTHRHGSEVNVFGLTFPNPVGLAAGFDVDGKFVGPLSDLGFGSIEIGSLSPEPQQKPIARSQRMLRNRRDKSLSRCAITNNGGVPAAIRNLRAKGNSPRGCKIGANLSANQFQNKDDAIISGFQKAFSLIYDFADYFVINISNPNEDGIRHLQNSISLAEIMDPLLAIRLCEDEYKPILVKVGNDIAIDLLDEIIDYCRLSGIDGIVLGNSARISQEKNRKGVRFLSGAPLFERTLALTSHIKEYTDGRFPVVACGGIMTPEQARQAMDAGASLIQIHTALMFEGTGIIRKINKALS